MCLTSTVPAGSRGGIRRAISLECELISNRSDYPTICKATDLSAGGMWVATAMPVRCGEHVVVCFEPDGTWTGGELVLFAEVARVITVRPGHPGGGMGLEFLDLEGEARAQLVQWLAARKMPVPRRRRPMPRIVPAEPPPLPTPTPGPPATPLVWR